ATSRRGLADGRTAEEDLRDLQAAPPDAGFGGCAGPPRERQHPGRASPRPQSRAAEKARCPARRDAEARRRAPRATDEDVGQARGPARTIIRATPSKNVDGGAILLHDTKCAAAGSTVDRRKAGPPYLRAPLAGRGRRGLPVRHPGQPRKG